MAVSDGDQRLPHHHQREELLMISAMDKVRSTHGTGVTVRV